MIRSAIDCGWFAKKQRFSPNDLGMKWLGVKAPFMNLDKDLVTAHPLPKSSCNAQVLWENKSISAKGVNSYQ